MGMKMLPAEKPTREQHWQVHFLHKEFHGRDECDKCILLVILGQEVLTRVIDEDVIFHIGSVSLVARNCHHNVEE